MCPGLQEGIPVVTERGERHGYSFSPQRLRHHSSPRLAIWDGAVLERVVRENLRNELAIESHDGKKSAR